MYKAYFDKDFITYTLLSVAKFYFFIVSYGYLIQVGRWLWFANFPTLKKIKIQRLNVSRLEVYTSGCSSRSGNNSSGNDTRLASVVDEETASSRLFMPSTNINWQEKNIIVLIFDILSELYLYSEYYKPNNR